MESAEEFLRGYLELQSAKITPLTVGRVLDFSISIGHAEISRSEDLYWFLSYEYSNDGEESGVGYDRIRAHKTAPRKHSDEHCEEQYSEKK